jgi:predicted metal-dependent hydrolase
MEEPGPVRELYRGILQVAVGYYHLLAGNYIGALKMFARCKPWLAPFPAHHLGVDVERLRQDVLQVEAELLRLGPDRMGLFDASMLRPVRVDRPAE